MHFLFHQREHEEEVLTRKINRSLDLSGEWGGHLEDANRARFFPSRTPLQGASLVIVN